MSRRFYVELLYPVSPTVVCLDGPRVSIEAEIGDDKVVVLREDNDTLITVTGDWDSYNQAITGSMATAEAFLEDFLPDSVAMPTPWKVQAVDMDGVARRLQVEVPGYGQSDGPKQAGKRPPEDKVPA